MTMPVPYGPQISVPAKCYIMGGAQMHTAWTYHHAIFMSLDHYKKPSKAVHSQWIMCRKLWYSGSDSGSGSSTCNYF